MEFTGWAVQVPRAVFPAAIRSWTRGVRELCHDTGLRYLRGKRLRSFSAHAADLMVSDERGQERSHSAFQFVYPAVVASPTDTPHRRRVELLSDLPTFRRRRIAQSVYVVDRWSGSNGHELEISVG
jgi:hypothetical protein